MSAVVLPFVQRAVSDPHLVGDAICAACGAEWAAVLPVGSSAVHAMECTHCGANKGLLKHFVRYDECPQWSCEKCNGGIFTAILFGNTPATACASCGHLRNAIDLFNGVSTN